MIQLTVNIEGKTHSDLELALEEVTRLVEEGYTSGMNRNDDGEFYFDSTGELEESEDEEENEYADEEVECDA